MNKTVRLEVVIELYESMGVDVSELREYLEQKKYAQDAGATAEVGA